MSEILNPAEKDFVEELFVWAERGEIVQVFGDSWGIEGARGKLGTVDGIPFVWTKYNKNSPKKGKPLLKKTGDSFELLFEEIKIVKKGRKKIERLFEGVST